MADYFYVDGVETFGVLGGFKFNFVTAQILHRFLESIHSFLSSPIAKELKNNGATGVGIKARGLYRESAFVGLRQAPQSLISTSDHGADPYHRSQRLHNLLGGIRKMDHKSSSKAFFAFHMNLAAMLVYDFFNDGQPQACSNDILDI